MKRLLCAAAAVLGLGLASQAQAAVGVTANGGVQGYTGDLGDALRAGPSWGVSADLQPKSPVGLELGYHGASNQLFGSGSIFNGPRASRVVQNGAEALAHVSIARSNNAVVEPYVLGGIGANWFHMTDDVPGFKNDLVGAIPVGAGINFHPRVGRRASYGAGEGSTSYGEHKSGQGMMGYDRGSLTLGLRGDYDFLFSDQFAANQGSTNYGLFTKQGGDTYRGLVTLGGNF